jgi:hypothetical protein
VLAGFGLEALAQKACCLRVVRHAWVGIVTLGVLAALSPSLLIGPGAGTVQVRWADSAPFHLMGGNRTQRKPRDAFLYTPHIERLSQRVKHLSAAGDILWSNASYAGGLVAALAHRPTASAMFYEVPPARPFDPIGASRWILWFKIGLQPGVPALEELRRRYALELVEEDELAMVFRNPAVGDAAHPPESVVPLWVVFVLLCAVCAAITWDFAAIHDHRERTHGQT